MNDQRDNQCPECHSVAIEWVYDWVYNKDYTKWIYNCLSCKHKWEGKVKRPSLEELEKILDSPPSLIILNPDGSISTKISNSTDDLIHCPFCHDNDFDHQGLKYHLQNHCEIYSAVDISGLGLFGGI